MTQENEREYQRRIRAWTLYDWANSGFATTILAGILPYYFSAVAGSSLASKAEATGYWTAGLAISLLIVAILSPILGTVSDIMRGKKRFLAIAAGVGIVATGALVLISTGDWILASILFIVGRVGFAAANVFYDALLPHVAREEDQDRVSTRGYATGYLGGGILLVLNVVMIVVLENTGTGDALGTWGPRLSFLSVAIWWAVFSVPIFKVVPEPATATAALAPGESIIGASFRRLIGTFRQLKAFRELAKFLIAFLIYNDGIGTIISVAVIYGAELGFGLMETVGALVLVQFVGIPYALIFGRIPSRQESRRPIYLAFIVFNLVAIPLVGILGNRMLPANVGGRAPSAAEVPDGYIGEKPDKTAYGVEESTVVLSPGWSTHQPEEAGTGRKAKTYAFTDAPGEAITLRFHGRKVKLVFALGPDHGIWNVEIDGKPAKDAKGRSTIDTYRATTRFEEERMFDTETMGTHVLVLTNSGERNEASAGTKVSLSRVFVIARSAKLGLIVGLLLGLQVLGAAIAWLFGPALFKGLAEMMDTKKTIMLALFVYAVIAAWGFFLDAVMEFWFLAWMVAVVQGGSQALSRSLYAHMSPVTKSGEFFGFFTVMSKFSAILGPILFAIWALSTDSSRPAILSLVLFFAVGGYLLSRVDVEKGHKVAREADAEARG